MSAGQTTGGRVAGQTTGDQRAGQTLTEKQAGQIIAGLLLDVQNMARDIQSIQSRLTLLQGPLTEQTPDLCPGCLVNPRNEEYAPFCVSCRLREREYDQEREEDR